MSQQYDNTDTFVLFKNDKGDNPKRPDYTGTINIDGDEYKLAAWIKEGKKGKFMTGKIGDPVEEREPAQPAQRQQQQRNTQPDSFDDDIPF
jgi:hypothetical protein